MQLIARDRERPVVGRPGPCHQRVRERIPRIGVGRRERADGGAAGRVLRDRVGGEGQRRWGEVLAQPQDVDRTAQVSSGIVAGCPHGNIGQSVSVNVAEICDGRSEVVVVREHRHVGAALSQHARRLHGPIGIQAEDMDGSPIGASGIRADGTDEQVGYAVAIEITRTRHGATEVVDRIEGRPAVDAALNRRVRLDCPVLIQPEDRDGSADPHTVSQGTDGQIGHAIAIQVSQISERCAPRRTIYQRWRLTAPAGQLQRRFNRPAGA